MVGYHRKSRQELNDGLVVDTRLIRQFTADIPKKCFSENGLGVLHTSLRIGNKVDRLEEGKHQEIALLDGKFHMTGLTAMASRFEACVRG